MGNIDLEVAQVLEDAADLYESEQINWCRGSWAKNYGWNGSNLKLSMCAEGALMKAAGFHDDIIRGYNGHSDHWLQHQDLLTFQEPGAFERFISARKVVSNSVGLTRWTPCSIPSWNDGLSYEDNSTGAKQKVIDKFREIAKDLRNQAPAEEL